MKDLLQKYIEGNISPKEEKEVVNWLKKDKQNMQEYVALHKLYDMNVWYEAKKTNKQKLSDTKYRRIIVYLMGAAAIFFFAFGISYFLFYKRTTGDIIMQTMYVPSGQRAEITLTDGTKVWLNAKTTFIFPNKFTSGNREVQLDGEGYFDVTSNASQPFIVKTKQYDVKAYGTEFNVIAYSEWSFFETALINGSVEVVSTQSAEKVLLKPNQRMRTENLLGFADENRNHVATTLIDNPDYFLWRDGLISFDDETVEVILNRMRLYFDIDIEVENKDILDYTYTGKFRMKDGIEHILKVLQLRHKFTYQKNDEKNKIMIN